MFGVRRRWPILTAAGAVLLYVVNNYQISGLENLHLEPLGRTQQAGSQPGANPLQSLTEGGLGFDLTQFGIQSSPSLAGPSDLGMDPYSATATQHSPAWRNVLSMGEKLALWQDKLTPQERSAGTGVTSSLGFPTSSPIPAPRGMSSAGFNGFGPSARGMGMSDFASSPSTTASTAPTTHESITAGMMTGLGGTALPTLLTNSPLNSFGAATGDNRTVRIASFHLPALGPALLNKPHVVQMLIAILRQYDVVALQGIQSSRDDVLPMIIDKLNQSGRRYDYLIGPRVGRAAPHHQFAYVFDTDKLETDRFALYSVDDPEDLMNCEPLVAWFRCKGVPQRDAFTFSLVNILIDPNFADAERSILPGLIDAVVQDGRNEDDWILLGDFAGGNAQLSMLDAASVRFALSDIPTDVAGTRMLDTLLFSARATTEFTGRAGAFDFLRKYNLSIERALEVSPHMPVWAEFSSIEGAQPGRIAPLIQ
ncbi:MAG: hypothetical protein R3C09_27050 [Pirellulaceae bacterium]